MAEENENEISDDLLEQRLNEEIKRWTMLGMSISGVPSGPGFQMVTGPAVDILQLEVQVMTLTQALIDSGTFDEEKLERMYKEGFLNRLTRTREAMQAAQAQQIPIAKNRLFGPNGEVLQ